MRIIYTPDAVVRAPQKPSWWRGWFKKTGTIAEHDGCKWILLESYSWGDYDGRDWHRYKLEEIPPRIALTNTNQMDALVRESGMG